MKIIFISSESRIVQGTKAKIYKRYGDEWSIRELGGGNGNWLLTKKSDILVDGNSYRSFVIKHYGKEKLTENIVNKFRDDLTSGAIQL